MTKPYIPHKGQYPPLYEDWKWWVLAMGRGGGKTRAAAEYVNQYALDHPGAAIVLVGATQQEVRHTMIEGESGLLSVGSTISASWPGGRQRIAWANGATAYAYGSNEAEKLRGPTADLAWAEDVERWSDLAAWVHLQNVVRKDGSKGIATMVPRLDAPVPAMIQTMSKIDMFDTFVTNASTLDNSLNLSVSFLSSMSLTYGGTYLGKAFIDGEWA